MVFKHFPIYIKLKFYDLRTFEDNEKLGIIMSKIPDSKMLIICNTLGGKYKHSEKLWVVMFLRGKYLD